MRAQNQWSWEPTSVCAESGGAWHFTSCPACQCNGHSNCSLAGAVCDQPCQHNTQVPHPYLHAVLWVRNDFFGSCQCNGHSNCSLASAVCDQPCQDNTQVPHLYGTHLQSCGSGRIFSDPASAAVTPTAPSPALCATNPASTIHRYPTTCIPYLLAVLWVWNDFFGSGQCNGHSNCSLASAVCDQPCQHNTQVWIRHRLVIISVPS